MSSQAASIILVFWGGTLVSGDSTMRTRHGDACTLLRGRLAATNSQDRSNFCMCSKLPLQRAAPLIRLMRNRWHRTGDIYQAASAVGVSDWRVPPCCVHPVRGVHQPRRCCSSQSWSCKPKKMVKRLDWVRQQQRVQSSDSKQGSRQLTGDKGTVFSRKYLGFSICNGKQNQNMRRLFLPVLTKTLPTPEWNLRPPFCHKQMREVHQKLGAVAGASTFNSCLFREAGFIKRL